MLVVPSDVLIVSLDGEKSAVLAGAIASQITQLDPHLFKLMSTTTTSTDDADDACDDARATIRVVTAVAPPAASPQSLHCVCVTIKCVEDIAAEGEDDWSLESLLLHRYAREDVAHVPLIVTTSTAASGNTSSTAEWRPAVVDGVQQMERNVVAYIRRRLFELASAWSNLATAHPFAPLALSSVPPYVTAGNVRRHPLSLFTSSATGASQLIVDATAVGREGDLVFGRVVPTGAAQTPSHHRHRAMSASSATRVMDAQHEDMYFRQPFFALVPLGNRESSTHVNGGVPMEGVLRGRDVVHWIAGESGLVGVLMAEGAVANALAETSVAFEMVGVLRRVNTAELSSFEEIVRSSSSDACNDSPHVTAAGSPQSPPSLRGSNVNLLDLADVPVSTELHTPIVCIAGTSAEAGKTTLAAKVISCLIRDQKLRVGCVKATGTGGLPDCDAYRAMGATVVLDQVDAGLPSTYTDPARVREYLPRSFLLCQDAGVDVIVVELGGDVIWANNTTLLAMPLFHKSLHRLFLLCNDTMAAIGAREFLSGRVRLHPYTPNQGVASARPLVEAVSHPGAGAHEAPPGDAHNRQVEPLLPLSRVVYVASPFRSHLGATLRAAAVYDMPLPLDPNDTEAIAAHLEGIPQRQSGSC